MSAKLQLVTEQEAQYAQAAASCVVECHKRVVEFLRVGQTLAQIDTFIAKQLAEMKCSSCFLGYQVPGSPKFPSHACLSVNECVVHGTAGYLTRPMVEGDVLKIDVGVWHAPNHISGKWIGDAAWTYCFKKQTAQAKALMDCGKESLKRGVRELKPENVYLQWAKAVQGYVEHECKFHLVRNLGGHGIGRKLHGPPFVANVVPTFSGEWPDALRKCEVGTLVAVEPMLAVGTGETVQRGKNWPVFSADSSLTVHYEHDVYIAAEGPRVLTAGLEELPDVVG